MPLLGMTSWTHTLALTDCSEASIVWLDLIVCLANADDDVDTHYQPHGTNKQYRYKCSFVSDTPLV